MFLQNLFTVWNVVFTEDLVWTTPLIRGVTIEVASPFTVVVDDKMGEMHSKFRGNTQSEVIHKHVSRRYVTHGSIFGENVIILVVTAKSLELSSWT